MAGLLAPVIWVYFECCTLVSKFDMWVISCLQPSPRSSAWVIPCERLVLGQAIEPWHFSVSLMNNNDLCANESWVTYQYANCWRVTEFSTWKLWALHTNCIRFILTVESLSLFQEMYCFSAAWPGNDLIRKSEWPGHRDLETSETGAKTATQVRHQYDQRSELIIDLSTRLKALK